MFNPSMSHEMASICLISNVDSIFMTKSSHDTGESEPGSTYPAFRIRTILNVMNSRILESTR